jgi:hypothetical protein
MDGTTKTTSHVRKPSRISLSLLLNSNEDYPTPVLSWTMVECSLAIVGANLPLLGPLLRREAYFRSCLCSLVKSGGEKRSKPSNTLDINADKVVSNWTKPEEDEKN